jgi:hypothetical protein
MTTHTHQYILGVWACQLAFCTHSTRQNNDGNTLTYLPPIYNSTTPKSNHYTSKQHHRQAIARQSQRIHKIPHHAAGRRE